LREKVRIGNGTTVKWRENVKGKKVKRKKDKGRG
jgi:hypothetical protein